MIDRVYETKTYKKTEEVLVSEKRYCDCCNKEITGPHWQIITGHNDWGNDSIDSIHHIDVCSRDCLNSIFLEYLDSSDHKGNTKYFDIEHIPSKQVKGEIEYEEIE